MSEPVNLFISPHLDDAVLSCGGYIFRLTASGKPVIIVTVFTEDVPAGTPLSRKMRWEHMVWRLENAPFAVRRREDAIVAAILQAQYVHLGFLDAIYRLDANDRPLYPKNHVRVPVHPDDWTNYEPILSQKIQQLLEPWEGGKVRVFCPLAIGEHVDHIIVRSAIEGVCESKNLVYYEDFPYVARPDANKLQIKCSDEDWRYATYAMTPTEIESRITAVACYVSQIPILFPSPLQHLQNRIMFHFPLLGRYLKGSTDLNSARRRISVPLKAYITRVGGERYWFRGTKPALELERDE